MRVLAVGGAPNKALGTVPQRRHYTVPRWCHCQVGTFSIHVETVYAQDHGAAPLISKIYIFVEILNMNDNTPLTMFPVYFPTIMENSKPSTPILSLEAFDNDDVLVAAIFFDISPTNEEPRCM